MDILPGTARKVALFLLTLSLAGWFVFMVSFIILAQDLFESQHTIVDVFWLPHWLLLIGGMVGIAFFFGSLFTVNKILNLLDTICVALFLPVCGALIYFNTLVVTWCTQSTELISCNVGLTKASLPLKLQAVSCGFIAISLVIYLLLQYWFVWSTHAYNPVAIQRNAAYGRLGADYQSTPTIASPLSTSTPYPPSSIDAAIENVRPSQGSLQGYERVNNNADWRTRSESHAGRGSKSLHYDYTRLHLSRWEGVHDNQQRSVESSTASDDSHPRLHHNRNRGRRSARQARKIHSGERRDGGKRALGDFLSSLVKTKSGAPSPAVLAHNNQDSEMHISEYNAVGHR